MVVMNRPTTKVGEVAARSPTVISWRSAAAYSSSVIIPFLWSASSVVSVSWKSVRSASLGGTLGDAVPAGGVLCCSAV